jgi:pimeloyl-ACP methyl ester carboxylesterase
MSAKPMGVRMPLVLLPGLLEDAAVWRPQIEALADVAAPIVEDLTRQSSIAAMAEAVLATAPDRFALAGHSMGGYVAIAITRIAPRRVMRLALVDTAARPDTPEQTERRHALIEMTKIGKFKGVTPRLLPLLVHADRLEDKAVTEVIMAMAERVGPAAFERQQTAIMNRTDQRKFLPRIACPTLVMCGRQDQITPLDRSEEMAAAIPGAALVVVEACGHIPQLERPAEATRAMREWLVGE